MVGAVHAHPGAGAAPRFRLRRDVDRSLAKAWSPAASGSWPSTFRELGRYPQTMLFLLAYLFFNDGIQTVIVQLVLYGMRGAAVP